jgi:nicotinamidase-related amidase
MSTQTAVVIVDAQVNMFDAAMPVYRAKEILANLEALCQKARAAGVPVVFVRHDGGQGAVGEYGTPGWQIRGELGPQAGEGIVDKRVPDAFEGTGLEEMLRYRGIASLVVAGMQTDYCINATARRAVSLGFDVTVIADAHSTYDAPNQTAEELVSEYNRSLGTVAKVKRLDELDF